MDILNSDLALVLILYIKVMYYITKNRFEERFLDKNENKNMLAHNIVLEAAVNNIADKLGKKTNNICLTFDNIFHK